MTAQSSLQDQGEFLDSAVERQVTLEAFYEMAQLRTGTDQPPRLVAAWEAAQAANVEERVSQAVKSCGILGSVIPGFAVDGRGNERSNQSKGNVAADALSQALNCDPNLLLIASLKGAGYPDRRLSIPDKEFACCFELKATSDWNERDSNRRVLTSSPTKLLNGIAVGQLPKPPCHLIGTIIYDRTSGQIAGVRLDFLEPDSRVNVRLEASTSHQLLARGRHRSVVLS